MLLEATSSCLSQAAMQICGHTLYPAAAHLEFQTCPSGAPCKIAKNHLWFSDPYGFIAFSRLELWKIAALGLKVIV